MDRRIPRCDGLLTAWDWPGAELCFLPTCQHWETARVSRGRCRLCLKHEPLRACLPTSPGPPRLPQSSPPPIAHPHRASVGWCLCPPRAQRCRDHGLEPGTLGTTAYGGTDSRMAPQPRSHCIQIPAPVSGKPRPLPRLPPPHGPALPLLCPSPEPSLPNAHVLPVHLSLIPTRGCQPQDSDCSSLTITVSPQPQDSICHV